MILLTCSYDGREFVRVGYYVNNEYDTPELNAEPPMPPQIERVKRNVLAEKPRVTRFAIKWYVLRRKAFENTILMCLFRDSEASAPAEFPPEQPEADLAADEEEYGAEEEQEEEVEETENGTKAEAPAGEDAEMGGAEHEAENGQGDGDAESDDGSVDLENESEEELEEEEEGEGEGEGEGAGEAGEGDGDAMEVDSAETKGDVTGNKPVTVTS